MNGNDVFDPPVQRRYRGLGSSTPRIVLHRLEAVRRAKGISRRVLAQRLGITVRGTSVEGGIARSLDQHALPLGLRVECLHYGTCRRAGRSLAPPIGPIAGGPADEGRGQASRPFAAAQHPAAGPDLRRAVDRDSSRSGRDCQEEPSPSPCARWAEPGRRSPPAVGEDFHATPVSRTITKCGREDSNLHSLRNQILSLTRLPISPRPARRRRGKKAAAKLPTLRTKQVCLQQPIPANLPFSTGPAREPTELAGFPPPQLSAGLPYRRPCYCASTHGLPHQIARSCPCRCSRPPARPSCAGRSCRSPGASRRQTDRDRGPEARNPAGQRRR